jgi:hypothetical protein
MAKKKSDYSKSPFRLQSKIKHYHQSYFLHYINKDAPEVSEELKKLTPKCVELFGEFPVTIHTQNDYQKLGIWFSIPKDQRNLWMHISTVLRECIWKESRDQNPRLYWLNFLRKNDNDLNEILKLESLTKFQYDFDSLLKKFRLEKEWLAESVFRAIWNGTGKLQIEPSYIEEIPKRLTLEIEKKLGIIREFLELPSGNKLIEISPLWEGGIPPPKPFTFHEQYWIYDSFEKYEEQAVEAYRQHVQDYFKTIEELFEKYGYKKHQGRQSDFERVRWLVFYIVKNHTSTKIIGDINLEDSTFWAAIKEFEKFDLPTKKKIHTPENSPSK